MTVGTDRCMKYQLRSVHVWERCDLKGRKSGNSFFHFLLKKILNIFLYAEDKEQIKSQTVILNQPSKLHVNSQVAHIFS